MKKFFAKLGVMIMATVVISISYVPSSQNHAFALPPDNPFAATDAECQKIAGKTCAELQAMSGEEQVKALNETCAKQGNCKEFKQTLKTLEANGTTLSDEAKTFANSPDAATTEKEPEPFVPNNDSLKDLKFNVGNVLSLDNENQEKVYFKGDRPPIIELILSVIEFATKVIGSVAIIILIIGGFMFMFSQGNEQNLSNAKDVIKYAIIGLIATFASYIAVLFVQSLFFDAGV